MAEKLTSLLLVIAVFLVGVSTSSTALGDLFTHHQRTPPYGRVSSSSSASGGKTAKSGYASENNIIRSFPQADVRGAVSRFKAQHPQFFNKATQCACGSSCDSNKVEFYFPVSSLTRSEIVKAVTLARRYNLTPIINIETGRDYRTRYGYFRVFERIRDKIPLGMVDRVVIEHDPGAIKYFAKYGGAYFRFDSVYGLRIGGKFEGKNFTKLYHIAFGR